MAGLCNDSDVQPSRTPSKPEFGGDRAEVRRLLSQRLQNRLSADVPLPECSAKLCAGRGNTRPPRGRS